MQHTNFTLTKPNGQPRKPRNQAEFRGLYIAELSRVAETNGVTLSNVPQLPIPTPTSRTGKKTLRKSFDADCRRLRRQAGVPARTGPPIPGSEKTGYRRWYTLEQCRRGGRLSGIARRDQAMARWIQIQTFHYRRHSLRAIARQVGLSLAQVQRIVAGRRWRGDAEPSRSAQRLVVNSVRGTPHTWARALALNWLYSGRCRENPAHIDTATRPCDTCKGLTTRRSKYLKGITKHRGADRAAEVVAATEDYVRSLSHLEVQLAVAQVNLDSGYKPAAGTYHGATYGQRRGPSSTACEDDVS